MTKRYEPVRHGNVCMMDEEQYGDWVRWKDYKELLELGEPKRSVYADLQEQLEQKNKEIKTWVTLNGGNSAYNIALSLENDDLKARNSKLERVVEAADILAMNYTDNMGGNVDSVRFKYSEAREALAEYKRIKESDDE